MKEKRPILARGEVYITPYNLPNGNPRSDKRPNFEEARKRLSRYIREIINSVEETPREFIMDEVVINMKMNVDYSAKSYHPNSLIKYIDAEDVGSKKWLQKISPMDKDKPEKIKIGKEIFIRIPRNKLKVFEEDLNRGTGFAKGVIENIRSIENVYFDNHNMLMEKFGEEWVEGRVEFVLHPFDSLNFEVKNQLIQLIEKNGGDSSKLKFKTYDSGITFVSAVLKREVLEGILRFNPIRTAHPILLKELPAMRTIASGISLPLPPVNHQKSSIKVGVFDGGVNTDIHNKYFNQCVVENNPIPTNKNNFFIEHGTGVVGAVLYGDLSQYNSRECLPTPIVNVESFRVFPLSDDHDIDLYEVIDIIEDVVPKRKDIDVYNLSIGPYGAIDDDNISRFTYAIDNLSKNGDKLFVIAVGNDGNLSDESLCRVQAPADSVNSLGVGAYCITEDNSYERASYSSFGDGREGCKIKPDFLEFGGGENRPFQLISGSFEQRSFSCGTSFATPVVAAKAAEIIGRCRFGSPLLARALLVHTAQRPDFKADKYKGHGYACKSVEDILSCMNNKVTTIYQSRLRPTQAIKLPFPYVGGLNYRGKVVVEWTIAIATEIDARNTEDYTLSCIEDTFYPNKNKFLMTKTINSKRKQKTVDIHQDSEIIDELKSCGWQLAKNPKSYSGFSNKYKTEQERKDNFKWDTILKRRATISYDGLNDPYLVLHAMERYGSTVDFINYSVIVTMDYLDINEDVYELTLNTYNKLEVAEIRNVNELLVK